MSSSIDPTTVWVNPRYEAYARAVGRAADEQLRHDRRQWPGGSMAGFMLWIAERWAEWRAANDRLGSEPLSDADHAAFDDWLAHESS